jgi:hypothetical protein
MPSKRPELRQQFLKPPPGTAGAGIVAAEFFDQLDIAMDELPAGFDPGFGWIGFAPLGRDLKS